MQINHFYSDSLPTVRNALDSIVLSPHTVRPNEVGLMDDENNLSDYQSVLPPVCSCEFHDQATCRSASYWPGFIRDKWRKLFRN